MANVKVIDKKDGSFTAKVGSKTYTLKKLDYLNNNKVLIELLGTDKATKFMIDVPIEYLVGSTFSCSCSKSIYPSEYSVNFVDNILTVTDGVKFSYKCGGYETTHRGWGKQSYQQPATNMIADALLKEFFGEAYDGLTLKWYDLGSEIYVSLRSDPFSVYCPALALFSKDIEPIRERYETYFKQYSENMYAKWQKSETIKYLEALFVGKDVSEWTVPSLKLGYTTQIEKFDKREEELSTQIKELTEQLDDVQSGKESVVEKLQTLSSKKSQVVTIQGGKPC